MTAGEELIPKGYYCYSHLSPMDERGVMRVNGRCPHWESRGPELAYCHFLKKEDDFLLWDQVKICGIKDEPDDADED